MCPHVDVWGASCGRQDEAPGSATVHRSAMSTRRTVMPLRYDSGIFSSGEARPGPTHQAALAELENTLRTTIVRTLAEATAPIAIASAQRGDQRSAVVLAGAV